MNRRWICNVWMDELKIWNCIRIHKDEGPAEPKLSVLIDDKWMAFPLPDHPLANKIRFRIIQIEYIDHFVIEFLRSNKHIWDRMGTKLELCIDDDDQPIWDIFVREIWPIFATNIRHLTFYTTEDLDNFRRRISPTILSDLIHLNSINSGILCPDAIADDGRNATAGQALTKWLHTPSKSGQPKLLFCADYDDEVNLDWINSFKEAFLRAISSVSYIIRIDHVIIMPTEPFELVNERTKEKLTLEKVTRSAGAWLLKRCPIGETVQWENDENWDDKLNNVTFNLWGDINKSIGPLSPPAAEEEKKEADESNKNVI